MPEERHSHTWRLEGHFHIPPENAYIRAYANASAIEGGSELLDHQPCHQHGTHETTTSTFSLRAHMFQNFCSTSLIETCQAG